MSRIKVLSVDWDYFIQATITERAMFFPDGGDYAGEIERTIWATHYVRDGLSAIKVSRKELNRLKECIANSKETCKSVMLCNSHIHLYDFITRQVSPDNHIDLYNIDFHHDVYTDSYKRRIDCGNWLIHLRAKYPDLNARWVARETSDRSRMLFPLKEVSYSRACANAYDYIFVCRSGLYSPPHLDKEFCKAFSSLTAFPNCNLEKNILKPRDDTAFYTSVEQLRNFSATLKNK